ncbi:hypothetical protein C8R44DRAFT_19138 [Mycena epipterygia]|nr:hypothetical protein C8R44DRAFT_19138 [Mycena epipterygia]
MEYSDYPDSETSSGSRACIPWRLQHTQVSLPDTPSTSRRTPRPEIIAQMGGLLARPRLLIGLLYYTFNPRTLRSTSDVPAPHSSLPLRCCVRSAAIWPDRLRDVVTQHALRPERPSTFSAQETYNADVPVRSYVPGAPRDGARFHRNGRYVTVRFDTSTCDAHCTTPSRPHARSMRVKYAPCVHASAASSLSSISPAPLAASGPLLAQLTLFPYANVPTFPSATRPNRACPVALPMPRISPAQR